MVTYHDFPSGGQWWMQSSSLVVVAWQCGKR